MYKENVYRTFNFWRDGDIFHIFLTVPRNRYKQYVKTIDFVKGILRLDFEMDFDDDQLYFTMGDFDEYKEFKEYFYRYLCCFEKENKKENED